jgi:N,N'-diacetyllegionaminate synthase
MHSPLIQIAGRKVGAGQPCFIIAEAGVNHNGSLELAHRLVEAAAEAGADAVKFQTFKAERLVTRQAPKADYQKRTTGAAESQFEMLERLELSAAAHVQLIEHCRPRNIQFLSTPFEEESADTLIRLGLKSLKIPSGEINNLPFLNHVARTGLPVILSTGMASIGEVEQAVEVFRAAGNHELALLHCVSNYPANPADCNLRALRTLELAFGLPVGFSDHTSGIEVALGAVALGACIIEKHFTLDRTLPGPDHQASLEPTELGALVRGIRKVESALGDGRKVRQASEENTAAVARKSLIARRDIEAGAPLALEDVSVMRPGTGLAPNLLPSLLGRRAKTGIPRGIPLSFAMLS